MMQFARVIPFMMGLIMMLGGCAQHVATISDRGPTPPVPPREEPRRVLVTGEVFSIPGEIQTPSTLVTGAMMSERELLDFEAIPSYQVRSLLRPKMKASNDVTGSFKLVFEGTPDFITIQLKPDIQSDGQVQLGVRIEATSADLSVDHVESNGLVRANAGTYVIYGPLRLDTQKLYVALRTDVQP